MSRKEGSKSAARGGPRIRSRSALVNACFRSFNRNRAQQELNRNGAHVHDIVIASRWSESFPNGVYQSTDNCFVNTTTTSSKPACSTNSDQSWCSTNVSMGAGPITCSASGLATVSGVNYCSAASGTSSPPDKCSTQLFSGGNGSSSSNCSAGVYGAGSTKSRCSAGGMGSSSPSGSGGNQCSAFTGQLGNNQQQTNNCSVGSDGGGADGSWNNCSTDGQNGNDCST